MSGILRTGQSVRTGSAGLNCQIESLLGSGGQGEVYRASVDGRAVAVKWYYPHTATAAQKTAIESLVRTGSPTNRFLWPLDLATSPDVTGFGYVMALREPRFKSLFDLMKGRVDPSFRALVTAALELSDSFLQLHAKGLSYCDISWGNVFFDPKTGEILICDNDNVMIDGSDGGGVYGTPRFMAPEIVRGEAKPSTQTDLFSLSVLLFLLLIVHHPLEGKKESATHCLDLPAMTKLYGTVPIFIFDPNDHSNEPDPRYHQNAINGWPVLPSFLRDLFTRAFTDGLRDPQNGRVREGEWRVAMARLRDSIFPCPHCSAENFYDPDALKANGGRPGLCWSCNDQLTLPLRIRIGGSGVVMLTLQTRLYPYHLNGSGLFDFSVALGEIVSIPNQAGQFGLRNTSLEKWVYTSPTGTVRDLEPGRTVLISDRMRLNFGRIEGEVRG
jgi:eukaryotic-like serine/threonine-protein kinase